MIHDVVEQLKPYCSGKNNTDKVEISVLQLNRMINALENAKKEQDAMENALQNALSGVRELKNMIDAENMDKSMVYDNKYTDFEDLISAGYPSFFEVVDCDDGIYCRTPDVEFEAFPDKDYYKNASNYLEGHSDFEIVKHIANYVDAMLRSPKEAEDGILIIMQLQSRFEFTERQKAAFDAALDLGYETQKENEEKEM